MITSHRGKSTQRKMAMQPPQNSNPATSFGTQYKLNIRVLTADKVGVVIHASFRIGTLLTNRQMCSRYSRLLSGFSGGKQSQAVQFKDFVIGIVKEKTTDVCASMTMGDILYQSTDLFTEQLMCRMQSALRKLGVIVYKVHISAEEEEEEDQNIKTITNKGRKKVVERRSQNSDTECNEAGAGNCENVNHTSFHVGYSHGTTVVWAQLGNTTLVGVDSQATQKFVANEQRLRMEYEIFLSGADDKLEEIVPGVHASLCGSTARIKAVLEYVRAEVKNRSKGVSALVAAVDSADRFLHDLHPPQDNITTTIHMCSWDHSSQRYVVIEVGDMTRARKMEEKVFGVGSGSWFIIDDLKAEEKIDEKTVKSYLLRAALSDPYSGGFLKVYSFENGVKKLKYRRRLLDERSTPEVANSLIRGDTMFVIIHKRDGHLLSRTDLVKHVQKQGFNIASFYVFWLCFPGEFVVYRVILPSPSDCSKWFSSSNRFKGHLAIHIFSIEEGQCEFYIGHATTELLEKVIKMKSIEDVTG